MAKKFNFRFETVLKLRAEKVTQAQESLNQVVKVRIEKEKTIEDYKNYKLHINNTVLKTTKASDLQNSIHHKQYIESEILRLEKEKLQIIEIEKLRRNKLTVAMKDEKVMEKLKDKKINQHNEDIRLEESKFFDEVGINQTQRLNKEQ
ncbi:MAG TPA: flagellar FliJ family protein [Candidatus Kapabacteria bacterium]|nr:flagellar FliJ family protein [Candidatus Kapabacteria bacterium]